MDLIRSSLSIGRLALLGIPGTCLPHKWEIISTIFLRLPLELPPFRVELSLFQLPDLLEVGLQHSVFKHDRKEPGIEIGQGPFAHACDEYQLKSKIFQIIVFNDIILFILRRTKYQTMNTFKCDYTSKTLELWIVPLNWLENFSEDFSFLGVRKVKRIFTALVWQVSLAVCNKNNGWIILSSYLFIAFAFKLNKARFILPR